MGSFEKIGLIYGTLKVTPLSSLVKSQFNQ